MLHSSQQFTKKTFILNSPLFEMFENEDGTGHSHEIWWINHQDLSKPTSGWMFVGFGLLTLVAGVLAYWIWTHFSPREEAQA